MLPKSSKWRNLFICICFEHMYDSQTAFEHKASRIHMGKPSGEQNHSANDYSLSVWRKWQGRPSLRHERLVRLVLRDALQAVILSNLRSSDCSLCGRSYAFCFHIAWVNTKCWCFLWSLLQKFKYTCVTSTCRLLHCDSLVLDWCHKYCFILDHGLAWSIFVSAAGFL